VCPGPTRTGFVDALAADVGRTFIYRRLADPGPVIEAGLRGLDRGRAVVIPGLRNRLMASGSRFLPREWMTRLTARLLRPVSTVRRPAIELRNEVVIDAPPERVWDVLADVEHWPSWYRACRWVRVENDSGTERSADANRSLSFWWKAHPVLLHSTVISSERPHRFAFVADARGLHADRTFTISASPDGMSSTVVDHETQVGPLPRVARAFIATRLNAANQTMLQDLARAVREPATQDSLASA
jgi:uncharacterized protein YndB with AHSA1/START domain